MSGCGLLLSNTQYIVNKTYVVSLRLPPSLSSCLSTLSVCPTLPLPFLLSLTLPPSLLLSLPQDSNGAFGLVQKTPSLSPEVLYSNPHNRALKVASGAIVCVCVCFGCGAFHTALLHVSGWHGSILQYNIVAPVIHT